MNETKNQRSDPQPEAVLRSEAVSRPKIALLGGDLRQIAAAKALAEEGFSVVLFAADTYAGDWGTVERTDDLSRAVKSVDLVVLPLPVTQDDERLHCPLTRKTVLLSEVFDAMEPGTRAVGGKLTPWVKELAEQHRIRLTDYLEREELAIANAVPTAEGALAIAMAEVPYTIRGAKCLVIGYGRIGKTLSQLLRAVGAEVTVAARKSSDLAWITASGCRALPFAELTGADDPLDFGIVFNTVPVPVLGAGVIPRLPEDVLLLDLASAPGGIDRDYAEENGCHVVWALSLPGKTAPLTAGKIIGDTVKQILQEEILREEILPERILPGKNGDGRETP